MITFKKKRVMKEKALILTSSVKKTMFVKSTKNVSHYVAHLKLI